MRADDLPAWLADGRGAEASLPAARVTAAEWNVAVGSGAGLFEKLQRMPVKLSDVAAIFVGLQTSADDVFIMNFVTETARTITLQSKALEQHWTFEKKLLHPVVSGTDVSPFSPLPNRQFILFPYRIENEHAELIPLKSLPDSWPRTAEYLKENKRKLEGREDGTFKGGSWRRFGRSQNLGIQNSVKLCVPRLEESLHAAPDFDGTHFLDNVDVGGGDAPRILNESQPGLLAGTFELAFAAVVLPANQRAFSWRISDGKQAIPIARSISPD